VEIDGFILESFVPGSATGGAVKTGLDALLSRTVRDTVDNVVFTPDLPAGQYLVVGVEIRRGSDAIADDAMSFRAYRATGKTFVFVGSTDLDGSVDLHAEALRKSPVGGEFWLAAWARASWMSPPTVTMRLFGFDGEKFRTVWTTDPFFTPYVNRAVQVTPDGGFALRRMPDFREATVINKQYAVTADGPQKVTEWQTQER
jgi:hypothetical protein